VNESLTRTAPASVAEARAALESAAAFLCAGDAIAASLGRRLRRGEGGAAAPELLELLEGLGALSRLLTDLERVAPWSAGRTTAALADIAAILRETVARLERRDWCALAELLESHLRRRLGGWRQALEAVAADAPR
jgi:hypothetical protein